MGEGGKDKEEERKGEGVLWGQEKEDAPCSFSVHHTYLHVHYITCTYMYVTVCCVQEMEQSCIVTPNEVLPVSQI